MRQRKSWKKVASKKRFRSFSSFSTVGRMRYMSAVHMEIYYCVCGIRDACEIGEAFDWGFCKGGLK